MIGGDTGAGKSTLFDAMTVSLFATTSGDRNVEEMRSTFASPEDDLTKAKDGGLTKASYYLALVYKANGAADQADKCVKEYLDSGNATSYELYDLGAEEMGEGNYTDALTYFNAALAMEKAPNKQNLMKSAITAYEYSGDFASAKSMLADYLEQFPSDEDAQRESTFLETR